MSEQPIEGQPVTSTPPVTVEPAEGQPVVVEPDAEPATEGGVEPEPEPA